ncbi:MAG: hypothetical protein IJ106_12095 [Parasporobacterium sp.]|nr:hypothetical protein [Parasporobacterium sp.]
MHDNEIKQINIADMLIYIAQHWRFAVIMLIVFAVLFGVFKGTQKVSTTEVAISDNEIEKTITSLSEVRKKYVEYCAKLILVESELRDANDDFLDNWYLMKIDPYNITSFAIEFYLDNHQLHEWNNGLIALVNAYAILFNDDTVKNNIVKIISESNDKEIIQYSNGLINIDISDDDKGIFIVTVYSDKNETGTAALDEIEKVVYQNSERIREQLGEHDIYVLGRQIHTSYDSSYRDSIIQNLSVSGSYNVEIDKVYNQITDPNEKQYLEYLIKKEQDKDSNSNYIEEKKEISEGNSFNFKSLVKYGIIGAIIGALIAVVLLALKYMFSNTLKQADSLDTIYNMPVLATMYGENEFYTKHNLKIDKWLRRIRSKEKHNLNAEEKYKLASTKISIACKQSDITKICIISDYLKNEKIVDSIIDKIEDKLQIVKINNILEDPSALEELSESEGVVLFEQIDTSFLKDICQEIKLCNKYGKTIIGAIVLS